MTTALAQPFQQSLELQKQVRTVLMLGFWKCTARGLNAHTAADGEVCPIKQGLSRDSLNTARKELVAPAINGTSGRAWVPDSGWNVSRCYAKEQAEGPRNVETTSPESKVSLGEALEKHLEHLEHGKRTPIYAHLPCQNATGMRDMNASFLEEYATARLLVEGTIC